MHSTYSVAKKARFPKHVGRRDLRHGSTVAVNAAQAAASSFDGRRGDKLLSA